MIHNYFKIGIRNLWKNKVFSIVNISGLAIGIACFISLFLFIVDELSYDKFSNHAGNVYRVYVHSKVGNQETNNSKSAAPTGASLQRDFPEVLAYTRIGYFGAHNLRYKEKVIRESRIYTADSGFFKVFSYPFLYGNENTALSNPNAIVLTETTASKYFGKENPVGKSFIVDGNKTYLVTGVMKDFPNRSHFSCDFLLSMSTYPEAANSQYWLDLFYSTYIVLKKGTNALALEAKIQKKVTDYVGPQAEKVLGVPIQQFLATGNDYQFKLQPLSSIYLYSKTKFGIDSNTEWGDIKTSDITYVYIFSAVALFILLIAIVNFMNLSTARSEKRAKEVGIKKTLGSNRIQLMGQFIAESVMMAFISMMVALFIVQIILPWFNNFTGKQLQLEFFNNAFTIPLLILFTLIVGFLAGSYPAFFLSSFQPADILKTGVQKRRASLRNLLVIGQFSVSIALIIGMVIIRGQLNYIQHKDLGINKDHLITISNGRALGDKIKAFKTELLKNPGIVAVANTSLMFAAGIPGNAYLFNKKSGTDPVSFQFLNVDYDFVKTFDVDLKAGRFFSDSFLTDSAAVIINEAAVRAFNTRDPLNKELTKIGIGDNLKSYKVIGVVKDFNYESLHREIRPLIFHLGEVKQPASILNIRIQPGNSAATIKYMETVWQKFSGDLKCNYNFLDQNIARMYEAERRTGLIATVFSLLAIFIACLGLFGLAVFITEQRIREIGIRKILGASIPEIVITISRQFMIWVIIANVIAWPVAYIIMHKWLQDFAFRINMNIWVFIASGVAVFIIALATVGIQSVKAAMANPVKSLRAE